MPRHPFRFFLLAVGALLAGCSHYGLGTGVALPFHSVYIAPVENRSDAPAAAALMSTLLRSEFLRDGRVQLVNSPEAAEATLALVLTGYSRVAATARPGDTGLARKFAVTLSGKLTLQDNRSGKVLFSGRPVDGVRDVFTDSGQLPAEAQALPDLAGDLAKKVAHAALDVW
ncbi:MAG: hypothetical protein RL324_456 [Verrucomicrobiota bacterium]|jgi:hypothetical protein